ncbi:serine/threonine protein kinase [Pilimelia terevasa]|uniref:non-specific serine/threonine protein kinase n=1 Tax=Pilimelia terevasa TaxID=53372 RepID=A0A8J3FKU7_9ACTN|nr:Stk1 family PASTA domain-containing Ser/Thr kinase [Pilimelia terevasa]GGK35046.1 serine/threonine protein kinase [Pilimelia terevasa]
MTAQARLLGGRYQVGELLGYGGMAEVHRGRDLRLGRDVAIKMLRTDLARDRTFQERFRREAQNAAALNHPAIVAVYDTGEEHPPTGETLPFIVMEFVDGRTLKEVLAAEGRIMPRRALEIVADICAALEFSHRHGIIHRDIKPGNVMLNRNGQVKVMDFGIARALASGATTMTQTSAVIGTAQYLSPEQARGEAVDARSDVYAGGCVLFELLCGHPPFTGDSPVAVAYQHVREDPRPPSYLNPEVGPDIDAIVLKALAKNPLNRYQSGAEMRADVLRAAAGRPVMATPVMGEDETALIGGAHTAATQQVAQVGDARRRKSSGWVVAAFAALAVLAAIALVIGLTRDGEKPAQTVNVPSLQGQEPSAAEGTLRELGLVYAVGDAVKSDDCVKNTVVRQVPSAGTAVDRGEKVTVNLCAGPDSVSVPTDLVGLTQAEAERRLGDLKLNASVTQVDSDATRGTVVKVPSAGRSVGANSRVEIQVSRGNLRPVPNVIGQTRDAAVNAIRSAGFEVVEVLGLPSVENGGRVLNQNPVGNRIAKQGSTVQILVARRLEPSATPSASPTAEPDLTRSGG